MTIVMLLLLMQLFSTHTVAVDWKNPDPSLLYNKVYRSHKPSGGTWTLVHKSTALITTWTDGAVYANQQYCYGATAIYPVQGESAKSNIYCVTIPAQ